MSEPQDGPTICWSISSAGMPSRLLIASRILAAWPSCRAPVSTRTRSEPSFCTLGSLAPASSTAPRTSATEMPCALASNTAPPLNSTPRSRPRKASPSTATSSSTPLAMKNFFLLPMMLKDFSPLCSWPPRSVKRAISGLLHRGGTDPGQRRTPLQAKALRADPGPLLAPREVRAAHQQGDHRLGEQEDHHDVDHRGHAEGERKALHVRDREVIQDAGGQQRDEVRGADGAPGPLPAVLDGGPGCSPIPDLVAQSFEEHHEGVRGNADGHDGARDACDGQPIANALTEQRDRHVGHARGQGQPEQCRNAQPAVEEQAVEDHQEQADAARDQAAVQLVGTQGGRDGV